MTKILLDSKKYRREIIVNKLIAFDIYDREDERLHQLSLTQLENEYRKVNTKNHPHDGLGSLRIRWKKK